MKPEVNELINIEIKLKDDLRLVLPIAFIVAGVLVSAAMLVRKDFEFNFMAHILPLIGIYVLVKEIKDRKKLKKRRDELRGILK